MTSFIIKLSNFLFYFILGLIVFGGFRISGPGYSFELAQINIFAIVLLALFFFMKMRKITPLFLSTTDRHLSLWQKGTDNDHENRTKIFLLTVLTILSCARMIKHYSLDTHMYDVTFINQPLFFPFLDRFLHCDVCRVGTFLGEHLSYTFLLLTPLTSFIHSDFLVFIFEPLTIGLGLWLLLKHGPLSDQKKYWLIAVMLFCCSSAFRSNQLWDFREDNLGFVFFSLMLIGLNCGKTSFYFLGLILAILTKENYAFYTFFVGIPILFDKELPFSLSRRKKIAYATFAISAIYFLFSTTFVIPHIMKSVESSNNILMRFPGLGSTFKEALFNLLTKPSLWWDVALKYLFALDSIQYFILLLLPFCYFSLRAPLWLLGALPAVFLNMLTPYSIQRMQIGHYELPILPFLFFVLLKGIRNAQPSNVHILMAFLIAFCGFGRSPVFELTRRLADIKNIPEVMKIKFLDENLITAADQKSLSQLSYIKHIRPIVYNDEEFSNNHSANLVYLYNKNVKPLAPGGTAKLSEAQQIVLNLKSPWGVFIYDQLYPELSNDSSKDWLVIINTAPTLWERLCQKTTCENSLAQ